ncbi:MAG: hypothetical protein R3B09_01115 [Nannocystaceae bacterium]
MLDAPGRRGAVTIARRFAPVHLLAVALVGALACGRGPTQVANPDFEVAIADPAFSAERAGEAAPPRVCVDEAHHNFHTVDGRYAPFAAVLRADGLRVVASTAPFTAEALAACDVLVIANALNERNQSEWSLPTPSAFTPDEIAAVKAWVGGGGGLWLIVDHMPFPGAAGELAGAFGFELANGFAVRSGHQGPDLFTRADGSIAAHPITDGAGPEEAVTQVATFTGHAFKAPDTAAPILVLPAGFVSLEPAVAWQFDDKTPRRDVGGWAQAATVEAGRGRVALFGEAAMFTSQVTGDGAATGLDHPDAKGNLRLLRNVVRWLVAAPRPG